MTALVLAVLILVWIVLLFLTFRHPGAPRVTRLLFFQLLLVVTLLLGYNFLVFVYDVNFNPLRVDLARRLTKNNMIYLGDLVPGLFDLDYIHRVDTDGESEEIEEEWVAFYQYDVQSDQEGDWRKGPWGGAIYDHSRCRPPAVPSFELVPVSYDYLGQDWVSVWADNVIPYQDPLSRNQDRPEVMIYGNTRGVVTDLNFFRKVGVELSCLEMQDWMAAHPDQAFPDNVRYENIGSFRGNIRVEQDGSTVTVVDRSPYERSQITIRRSYRPENGSYFDPITGALLPPVEVALALAPFVPEDVSQVYYPEKAVLAFYRSLGKDEENLERAEAYLSPYAQQVYGIKTDPFGLSTDPSSVARARKKLARVLVWEIGYQPDIEAEHLHQDRDVTVTVVGVNDEGEIDYDHPCQVTWTVVGIDNPQALPYGCEWRLESYWTTCVPTATGTGVGK